MLDTTNYNIDEETITRVGLKLSQHKINAQFHENSRVFEYPGIENVYVMESDLYGNAMPKDSCFLVFSGRNGLIGKHLKIETLRNANAEEIKNMVDHNTDG